MLKEGYVVIKKGTPCASCSFGGGGQWPPGLYIKSHILLQLQSYFKFIVFINFCILFKYNIFIAFCLNDGSAMYNCIVQ